MIYHLYLENIKTLMQMAIFFVKGEHSLNADVYANADVAREQNF